MIRVNTPQEENNNITVVSPNNTISVNTKNSIMFSEDLSQQWATKMDGKVKNEDFSSKYYAKMSAESAEIAETNANISVSKNNELTSNFEIYNSHIIATATNAENNITQTAETTQNEISTIKQTAKEEINNSAESAKQEINTVATSAKQEITTTKDDVVQTISTTKSSAVTEITQEGQKQIANIERTGFYMRDDKLYFINSKGEEKEFKSGGGFEIGDIAPAPLGIDETKGLRRYLNGQVIIQDQFVEFTNKVKTAQTLYPNLFDTEENWQATVTMSAFGACYKFVVDDVAGTIRLPKITGFIQGLTDLASLGDLVEAGLPDHTHTQTYYTYGQLAPHGGNTRVCWEGSVQNTVNTGKASQSNSTYSNSNTVQPESGRYPYFIQVATGVETEDNIINEIELNNPYSLLDVKWSDKLLNNISWLRSQGQANSKAVYNDVYELILKEYNSGTDETETVGGVEIVYRRGSETNIKVTTDKSAYDSILSTTGTAWYYVIDTANETFYLPQSDGFLQFGGSGDFVEAGLPNIEGKFNPVGSNGDTVLWHNNSTANGAFTKINSGTKILANAMLVTTANSQSLGFDASLSNSIYGNSTTVQPNAVKGYLYFYVGETVQNANLINAGRIEEKVASFIPNNHTVWDGQWVNVYKNIYSAELTSDFNVIIDLSSILPNDGYMYECLFRSRSSRQDSSGTNNYIALTRTTDEAPTSVGSSWIWFCIETDGANFQQSQGLAVMPIGTERNVRLTNLTYATSCNLWFIAYRRIGTNI